MLDLLGSRRFVIVAGLVVVLVAGIFGLWWVAITSISPEQRVADAEPPPAPVVNAAVERRILEETVQLRGVVVAPVTQEILPVQDEGSSPILTFVVEEGTEVEAGSVLASVSDRPVIALSMQIPLYRTIEPGDEGQDVSRLQSSLVALGFYVGETDGVYGPRTQEALRDLYTTVGFEPLVTDPSLQIAADEAALSLDLAQAGLATAQLSEDPAAVHVADLSVRSARRTYDAAQARVGLLAAPGELIGLPDLPTSVVRASAQVGEILDPTQPILSLASPERGVVDALVQPGVASLLAVGDAGFADADADALELQITSISPDPAGSGGSIVRFAPVIEGSSALSLGAPVTIAAQLESTGQPVLAIPISAVRSDSEGPYLSRDEGAEIKRVAITTGRSIGGWVEIVESAPALSEGDQVRMN